MPHIWQLKKLFSEVEIYPRIAMTTNIALLNLIFL